jgi:murein DD-endopeptidase MepM/ murein hydrolase activator NlpD
MKIYKAINYNCNQGFDASPSMVDFYKSVGLTTHGGYDFGCPEGTPIFFDVDDVDNAYVLNTEIDNAGGLGINIITESKEGTFKHRYWHLSKFGCKAGNKVFKGDLIGWTGNTGRSTGAHLHRDVKEMENGVIKNRNNGTFGTIRIEKWLENYDPNEPVGVAWLRVPYVLKTMSKEKLIRSALIAKLKYLLYK